MATRAARKKSHRSTLSNLLTPDAGIETRLHAACVQAGAGAALQVVLERLPLLKPLLPNGIRQASRSDSAELIQRRLIQTIYSSYQLKPAAWEIEGIFAVAQTQSVLSPLATRSGLDALLKSWLPDSVSAPLLRYTPLEPLITATSKTIAATWAAGRYADSVCRLRQAGADWLPAPLADALKLAPATLRSWSAEALSLAMPPLRLATAIGKKFGDFTASATSEKMPKELKLKPNTKTKRATKKSPSKKSS